MDATQFSQIHQSYSQHFRGRTVPALTMVIMDVSQQNKLEKKVHKIKSSKALRENFLHCFWAFRPRNKKNEKKYKAETPVRLRKNLPDNDFGLLELASSSDILCAAEAAFLESHLPARSIGFPWKLLYSTTVSGFSLNSMYRKMKGVDQPVILIIEDMHSRVFGAYVPCGFSVQEKFFGDQDTFLFRFHPKFEVYKWSGRNFFFMQAKETFISVGSDNGRFGLWLDDTLDNGRTEQCSTFFSPPLVEEKDFKVRTIECWSVDNLSILTEQAYSNY